MKRLFPFALVLSLMFSACVSATPLPKPTSTPTETPTPTATATTTATATLVPTQTIEEISNMSDQEKLGKAPASPEGYIPSYTFKDTMIVYKDEEGKVQKIYDLATGEWKISKEAGYITLEDWKKVFSGPYIGDNGKQYDLSTVLDGSYAQVLTDPAEVAKLAPGSAMIILNPNGEITVYANPDKAAEKAKNGAIVVTNDSTIPDALGKLALNAANKEYLNGNNKITVQFDESFREGNPLVIILDIEKYVLIERTEDGRYFTPVLKEPKHFSIYDNASQRFLTVATDTDDNKYWIEGFLVNSSYDIAIEQSDNFITVN